MINIYTVWLKYQNEQEHKSQIDKIIKDVENYSGRWGMTKSGIYIVTWLNVWEILSTFCKRIEEAENAQRNHEKPTTASSV